MNSSIRLTLLAAIAVLCPVIATAAEPAMKGTDMPMPPGPSVGEPAPAFTLKDAAGTEVSFASLVLKGKVALVFHRSADWCPFCIAQLKELQASLPALEQAGITVVAISYDSVEALSRAKIKHGLTFPLLSDEGSKTIDAYGIRNHEAKGKGAGVPNPAIFVLTEKGLIHARLMHDGYRTRPTPAEIIAAANGVM